jgi:membrane protease YdiL (CAAX protease family)
MVETSPRDAEPELVAARPVAPPVVSRRRPLPLELTGLSRRDAALDLALVLLIALIYPFGLNLVAAWLGRRESLTGLQIGPLIQAKWMDAFLVVSLAAYFVYRQHLSAAAFGLQSTRWRRQLAWSLPTLAAMYAAMIPMIIVITALVVLVPAVQHDIVRRKEFLGVMPLNSLGQMILLLVPVAIHEELLFRGLLIPYLKRIGCGWVGAIAISTAIFASLHIAQGWLGIVQIFPVGLALAILFLVSRSLVAVIIAHFAFDLLQMQLARVLLPSLEKFLPGS